MSVHPEPLNGLPPVAPPTGKFLGQLFLAPLMIVGVAVGILWSFTWLIGGSRTPAQFLHDLSNPNPEVRWRAASDLAQVLKKDPQLAANPHFALDLAELLRQALRDSEQLEQTRSTAEKPAESDAGSAKRTLQGQRDYVQFLISCLGNFELPIGVPLLSELVVKEDGGDAQTVTLRRQDAVWSLANLGDKLKQLAALPAEKQDAIRTVLEEETSAGGERGAWARVGADYLKNLGNGPQALGVDLVGEKCARSDDWFLRKLVALALSIWEGDKEANRRMDDTLLRLSYDDGHGAGDEQRVRGLEIRYMAVQALARRGSPRVAKRFGLLQDMLDAQQQAANFRTPLADGRATTDEAAIASTLTSGLKAVAELHRREPTLDLSEFAPAIDKLANSPNPVVKAEAERTQLALYRR